MKKRTVKPKITKHVWQGEPVTADELNKLRDRLVAQASGVQGMKGVLMTRVALDADHLASLMDREDGTRRLTWWVEVKGRSRRKPKQSQLEGGSNG